MQSKVCFKCHTEKPIEDYYKHGAMSDCRLNKCKECTKADVREREARLKLDPLWVEKERERGREKYHRLEYRGKHYPTSEAKVIAMRKYRENFPEKQYAKNLSQRVVKINQESELHHWSYNVSDAKDVIELSVKQHYKAHRFIVYDQERMMYRRTDNNELLDTKEKHQEWIMWCIENKAD